eukprot:364405-Chlamydomonas_euryale.AAC.6
MQPHADVTRPPCLSHLPNVRRRADAGAARARNPLPPPGHPPCLASFPSVDKQRGRSAAAAAVAPAASSVGSISELFSARAEETAAACAADSARHGGQVAQVRRVREAFGERQGGTGALGRDQPHQLRGDNRGGK